MPCKNYLAVAWKGRKPSELKEAFQQDEQRRDIYMAGLREYERKFNESGRKRVTKGAVPSLPFAKTVQTFDRTQLSMDKDLGVFWPVPIYEDYWKKKAKNTTKIFDDNKWVPGVVLDSRHGCITGCTRLSRQTLKGAELLTEAATTQGQLREGQVQDTWEDARSSVVGMLEVKSKSDPNMEGLLLSARKKSRKADHDTSTESDVDYGFGSLLKPGNGNAGAKRKATNNKESKDNAGDDIDEFGEPSSAKKTKMGKGGSQALRQFNAINSAETTLKEALGIGYVCGCVRVCEATSTRDTAQISGCEGRS